MCHTYACLQQLSARETTTQPQVSIAIQRICLLAACMHVCRMNAYCPAKYLDWGYRCKLLLKQLESWAPDLLCLQGTDELCWAPTPTCMLLMRLQLKSA